ncbi:MAG: MarR family winged helix-turn-helix transcriptional regulator [Eubacterium sp.]
MTNAQQLDMGLRTINNFLKHSNDELHNKIYPEKTASYGYIIAFLCENSDKYIYQRDIESEFDLSRSTVSTIIKELEDRGLVERHAVMSDARLKRVIPTEGAKMINEICKKDMNALVDRLMQGAQPSQTESFFAVLEIMKNNVHSLKKQIEQFNNKE